MYKIKRTQTRKNKYSPHTLNINTHIDIHINQQRHIQQEHEVAGMSERRDAK